MGDSEPSILLWSSEGVIMEQHPTSAGGWFAQAIGTAIFSGLAVLVMGGIGAALWSEGYVVVRGLLLVCAAGGAFFTAWTVVGSIIAGAATAAGLMKDDD
jgi:hypothetical protein